MGFASLNTGNNLLYMVLSVLLSFLVLSGVFSEAALRGVRVRRRLPEEIFAGSSSGIVLEVTNEKKRVPSYAIVVEEMLGADFDQAKPCGRGFFFHVPPGGTVSRVLRWKPDERGPQLFAGFRVWTRFPFGLFAKSLMIDSPEEVLVYPRLEPVALAEGNPSGARGERSAGQGGESPEAAGVREFAAGDSFRRVHWRHTLRHGALFVRDREQEQRSELVVQLASQGVAAGLRFEDAVSRAASLVVAHLAAGWRVGLRTEEGLLPPDVGPSARRAMLARLARAQPTEQPHEDAA
ncbi:MAG: hypothetical protein CL910_03290 [Deltaproteobacteria bacterium]|nr:hypothetical protein [Deltaproteobacteria bacterium]